LGPAPVGGVLSIVFAIVWKLFDMAIGAIQAFIFALLTVLYFGMASGEGHSDEHDEHEQVTEDVPADAPDRSPQPELVA
jgi:F-type H+-transporting ATPase subunit a